MDYLWTPWRYNYVTGLCKVDQQECVFCHALALSDEDALIVHRAKSHYIILNRFPYTSGHCMVVPYRHFSDFSAMMPEESEELMVLAQALQRAMVSAYEPEGFNIGWNQGKCAGAGVAGHIHLHLVPRWNGDTNSITVLSETRVLPEDLKTTWEKLRHYLHPGITCSSRKGFGSQTP